MSIHSPVSCPSYLPPILLSSGSIVLFPCLSIHPSFLISCKIIDHELWPLRPAGHTRGERVRRRTQLKPVRLAIDQWLREPEEMNSFPVGQRRLQLDPRLLPFGRLETRGDHVACLHHLISWCPLPLCWSGCVPWRRAEDSYCLTGFDILWRHTTLPRSLFGWRRRRRIPFIIPTVGKFGYEKPQSLPAELSLVAVQVTGRRTLG